MGSDPNWLSTYEGEETDMVRKCSCSNLFFKFDFIRVGKAASSERPNSFETSCKSFENL